MSQPKSLAEQLEALVNGGSRPSWDEYFMATAVLVSSRSSCERPVSYTHLTLPTILRV